MINGKPILPDGWIEAATTKQAETYPGSESSYGYQWWTLDDGDFSARGIFGQGIFIDSKMNLIIASNSNWPDATDAQGDDQGMKRFEFYTQVQKGD